MTFPEKAATSRPIHSFLRDVRSEFGHAREPAIQPTNHGACQVQYRRKLSIATTPISGESLRGLVARACHRNHIPNSWSVLRHLGLPHRNNVRVSEDNNVIPAELAYALGTTTQEIEQRRYPIVGAHHFMFHGLALHSHRLENSIRRFSPVSLAAQEIHRSVWELRDLPFCTIGWDMLQERCPCEGRGLVQRWTRTLSNVGHCDSCGDDLSLIDPVIVPIALRHALSLLGGLADPDEAKHANAMARLPDGLQTASRQAVFDAIILLARTLTPKFSHALLDKPEERLRPLHAACGAVLCWPTGLDRLQPSSAVPATTWVAASKAYLGLSTPLASNSDIISKTRGSRANLPTSFSDGRDNLSPKRRGRKPETRNDKPIGVRPASELARITPTNLFAIHKYGLITRHYRRHGSTTMPAFDPEELQRFAENWHLRVDAETLASRLGISVFGAEQLAALGIIPARGSSLPGTGPHFIDAAVSSFLDTLRLQRSYTISQPIALLDGMRRVTGRPKPWGPVFTSMLSGQLPFALKEGRGSLAHRLSICRDSVAHLTSLNFERSDHPDSVFSETMPQRDALDILNVSVNRADVLDTLGSSGRNPKLYLVREVEALARIVTTLPEIANALETSCTATYHNLRRGRVSSNSSATWDRQAAGRFIAATLDVRDRQSSLAL